MTVKELKEKLKDVPENAAVVYAIKDAEEMNAYFIDAEDTWFMEDPQAVVME